MLTTGVSNLFTTHDVFNQSAPLQNYDLFTTNAALAISASICCGAPRWASAR